MAAPAEGGSAGAAPGLGDRPWSCRVDHFDVATPLPCSTWTRRPLVGSKNFLLASVHPPSWSIVNRPEGVFNLFFLVTTLASGRYTLSGVIVRSFVDVRQWARA